MEEEPKNKTAMTTNEMMVKIMNKNMEAEEGEEKHVLSRS